MQAKLKISNIEFRPFDLILNSLNLGKNQIYLMSKFFNFAFSLEYLELVTLSTVEFVELECQDFCIVLFEFYHNSVLIEISCVNLRKTNITFKNELFS